jgi:aminoglycoside 2''-phosphotransferase
MNSADVEQALSAFADIRVERVEKIEGGWSSHTFLVDDELIFRFARFDVVARNLRREIAVLPVVQQHLSYRVPVPEWTGDFAGRPFVGYRMIPGRPITPDDILRDEGSVDDIVEMISELHRVPIDIAGPLLGDQGRPEWWQTEYRRLQGRIEGEVLPLLDDDVADAVRRGLEAFLADDDRPSRLVHRDLGIDHVLLDPQRGRVSGIIDFEFIAVGDPAIDFVGFRVDLPPEICRRALDAYDPDRDPGFDERVDFYAWMGAVHAIRYGLETHDDELVEGAKVTTRERLVWAGLLSADV